MSFTLNDIALLLIALVIGLIFGLMMSGRGKYRRAWRDEQLLHRQSVKERDTRIEAAETRVRELERQAVPVGAGAAGVAAASATHERDDLSRINGISQAQEAALEARLGLRPGTIVQEDWRGQARTLETKPAKRGLFG